MISTINLDSSSWHNKNESRNVYIVMAIKYCVTPFLGCWWTISLPPLSSLSLFSLFGHSGESFSKNQAPRKLSGDFRKKLDPIKLLFGKGSRWREINWIPESLSAEGEGKIKFTNSKFYFLLLALGYLSFVSFQRS